MLTLNLLQLLTLRLSRTRKVLSLSSGFGLQPLSWSYCYKHLFVRFVKEIFISTLKLSIKWLPVFLDRVYCSRWLPLHIRDKQALSRTHSDILRNFVEGKFAIRSSEKNFSSISIDQANEQNKKHFTVLFYDLDCRILEF